MHQEDKIVASNIITKKPEFLRKNIDSQGNSLLHIAANDGNYKLAKFLLENNPNLALLKNDAGNTAYHLSILGCYEEISYLLIKINAEIIKDKNNDNLTASQLLTSQPTTDKLAQKADDQDHSLELFSYDHKVLLEAIGGNSAQFNSEFD